MSKKEQYYLLGETLKHSYSKIIHNKIADYKYNLKNLSHKQFDEFMKAKQFSGLNVTIPYKRDVLKYCDVFSKTVAEIGSANTIVKNLDGSLYADNTDYRGFLYLAKKMGVKFKNKNILVLGSGGTSLTVRTATKNTGAKNIYVVSRSGKINYNNVYDLKDIEVIVNTTPVGMYPNNYSCPIDITKFGNIEAVIDVVYNPLKTELVQNAENIGVKSGGGLSMLVAQAVYSAELFTGRFIHKSIIDKIENDIRKNLTNIVFIGMPGCGKTTLSKIVSRELKRKYADIDRLIVNSENRSIQDIFNTDGEIFFRNLETETIKKVSKKTGIVIATGGGAVKNPENINVLKSNGLIFYVDRDVSELSTKGRPLSASAEEVQKLYEERRQLYNSYMDYYIKNDSKSDSIEKVAEKTVEAYNEHFDNKRAKS